MDYDKFCKKCKHYDFSLQSGILCGLTTGKPSFTDICDKFEIDLNREQKSQANSNTQISKHQYLPDLEVVLKKWGIALIVLGVLHLLLTQFLDPIWGGLIIILGILNLSIKKKEMLIVNGILLLFVGTMNSTTVIFPGENNFTWLIFGVFQIYLGIKEIIKFNEYKKEEIRENSTIVTEPLQSTLNDGISTKHSGFGVASFIIFCSIFLISIITFISSIIMGLSNPEGLSEESVATVIIGFSMMFSVLLSLVGVGFGITGLITKNRKKVYPVLGLVLNTIIFIIFILMFLSGAGKA